MKNRAQGLIKNRPNRIDRDLTLQSNKGLRRIFMPKKNAPSQGQKTSFFVSWNWYKLKGGFRMWQEAEDDERYTHVWYIRFFFWLIPIPNFSCKASDLKLLFKRSGHFRTSVQYSWGLLLGHMLSFLFALFSLPLMFLMLPMTTMRWCPKTSVAIHFEEQFRLKWIL